MIELVFVIVVLGILASIAIPKFWATRDDAIIAKARSDVATIRSAILSDRQKRILLGKDPYRTTLDDAVPNQENEALLDGNSTDPLLEYPIYSKNAQGHWMKIANNPPTYLFILSDTNVTFTYQNGKFDCDHSNEGCRQITQ